MCILFLNVFEVNVSLHHLFPCSWYPPGHGDIYQSFYNSGLLSDFIDEGKEYMFVSNIDNLGATVDINILLHLMKIYCGHLVLFLVTCAVHGKFGKEGMSTNHKTSFSLVNSF